VKEIINGLDEKTKAPRVGRPVRKRVLRKRTETGGESIRLKKKKNFSRTRIRRTSLKSLPKKFQRKEIQSEKEHGGNLCSLMP